MFIIKTIETKSVGDDFAKADIIEKLKKLLK